MRPIRRVLIPSDNRDFVVNFAEAYSRLGYDVTVGCYNFELTASQPDLVHFLWPEELTAWKVPSLTQIDTIIGRLDRWAQHARIIITVNNLYPHRHDRNPLFHRLYEAFYQRAEVIHHFGHTSKQMVCKEYPAIANRNHVVRLGFNYDRLLPIQERNRAESRRELDIRPNEMLYLVFGSLRFWSEVQLIQRAFKLARVPNKRLMISARYIEAGPIWQQRWRRWHWHHWQRSRCVLRVTDYVPDEQVYKLFDAADAVVVVRHNSMGSGVPSLAMTFGRMVICPDSGALPDYVKGAPNEIYGSLSAQSLAEAMERSAKAERERIGARNRQIAAGWDWNEIIDTCLKALPPAHD